MASRRSVALHEAAQTRYLNYALSVITSRALPDVRDGLKPVQRRILYTMWQQNLTADAKHRKCAKVVGDVMGNYHPHGDAALYETLVRMAQSFSLRYPLVSGSGNFGSLDGDSAAAMRYTECRLARLSDELLTEIDQTTVPFRPNYDGTRTEPVVLPSRIPNLLINGATGIAVGMATNIPPHNLNEICTALIKLLDNPDLTSVQLCRYVKGPDFPTGGQMLNSPEELKQIYKTGSGAVRLRATWEEGPVTRGSKTIYITSVPYTVNKSTLVERIAEVALSRKLPPLVDVQDLSTEDVRIALELKKDSDEKMVMAYLFKHTPLQTSFVVNLTCLEPTEANVEVGRPKRMDLHEMLFYFLHFRLEVVTKRLEHELAALKKRVHILEGFEKVFDALDEILKIVRKSEGKQDAAEQIIKRFGLDADQTDAILELKIYRLARLEILIIRKELEEKRRRTRQINTLLQGRGQPLGHRPHRDRGDSEEVRRRPADGDCQRRRRGRVLRRRLHRRRRQRRAGVARRVGEAPEGGQGRGVHARPRGRLGARGDAREHASVGRVLQQFRRRLHRAGDRHPRLDRVWRADPAVLQAEGRRANHWRAEPRSESGRRHHCEEGRGGTAGSGRCRDQRWLQPALQPRAFRRAEHARGTGDLRGPLKAPRWSVRRGSRVARSSSPRRGRRARFCRRSRRSTSSPDQGAASS